MTDLVDQAFSSVRALPRDRQDEVARIVMHLVAAENAPYVLSDEERADLEEAEAEIARGELASGADVAALWSKPL